MGWVVQCCEWWLKGSFVYYGSIVVVHSISYLPLQTAATYLLSAVFYFLHLSIHLSSVVFES